MYLMAFCVTPRPHSLITCASPMESQDCSLIITIYFFCFSFNSTLIQKQLALWYISFLPETNKFKVFSASRTVFIVLYIMAEYKLQTGWSYTLVRQHISLFSLFVSFYLFSTPLSILTSFNVWLRCLWTEIIFPLPKHWYLHLIYMIFGNGIINVCCHNAFHLPLIKKKTKVLQLTFRWGFDWLYCHGLIQQSNIGIKEMENYFLKDILYLCLWKRRRKERRSGRSKQLLILSE